MFGGKSPPSLKITTGAAKGANYVDTPHRGGSVSSSSATSSPYTLSSSDSSSPCPSTPSPSSSTQHSHFQPHQGVGDPIPSQGSACGTGCNEESKQQRMMHKKGRGGNNWLGKNFMSRGPPFPPPNAMFFSPPPYSSSGMPVATLMMPPAPPYSMAHPPFFVPPRLPSLLERSYGKHSHAGESSEKEEIVPSHEVNLGKRSYLIYFRPKALREEPDTTPFPIGDKEFETFTSKLTKGNEKFTDTQVMDIFIVDILNRSRFRPF